MIYNFTNDYSEGCHPSILDVLIKSNLEQQNGYGEDVYTQQATNLLRGLIKDESADIHLISGGTLTNILVLSAILKPFESVIAAETGHINTHEAGAIEATGHKVETVPTFDGKLNPELIEPLLNKTPTYHTVKPKVVYISNSTELGTVYTKKELSSLSKFCKKNDLLLFIDGARLSFAISAKSNDLTLEDVAKLADIFYLGGTKCGALLGEAIVITKDELKKDFKYHVKQRGAMLAKGRLLGIQFYSLLKDHLLFKLAQHSNEMAAKLSFTFKEKGYSLLTESDTNQIFPILPNTLIKKLQKKYNFYIWQTLHPDQSVIRLITSWATPKETINVFIDTFNKLQ